MITQYIKGDIVALFLSGKNIAHGCNCFHTMGSGVAGQLAKAYPRILEIDKTSTDYGYRGKLGDMSIVFKYSRGPSTCFNLYTQYEPGPNLDYHALVNCMVELNRVLSEGTLFRPVVYIPRIGCGIAGGDWEKVSMLIDIFTPDIDLIVVDYEPSPNS